VFGSLIPTGNYDVIQKYIVATIIAWTRRKLPSA